MLGNKRKFNIRNDCKNNLNSDTKLGGFFKKKRKIKNNNIKINMKDTKKY